jgi:4-hydroxyphenylpyruvate dioxygenase
MSGTLRQKLEAIAAARFDAIELFEPDFIQFNGSARELAAMAADLGLAIDLYQPFRDFEGMPDELFARSLDRAERKFDLMEQLGAPLVLVCSNTSPHSLGDSARSAAQLHALAKCAARRNLRIGFEALAWGRYVNLYRQAWDIVRRVDHPHLGLILDSFHTLSLNDDPAGIAAIPGDRIFFVQMADAPILTMDVLQWARHFRNFPGQGQFDVEGFFESVLLSGYSGTLSLEIFNDIFRETPNRRTAVDAMRSLLYLESRVRSRLEARTDPSAQRALARVELFNPPAPTFLSGFAFLEFGLNDAGAKRISALLEQMGFAFAGRHRSKQVTLYRQSDICLVVNSEPNSDARARFDELGPSVCAFGLRTADVGQAANRATALLSARFDSPRSADELYLPAIRSPGGMLVHFVPEAVGSAGLAAADFPTDAARNGFDGVGIRSIDHIALGLAPDQLDTWFLFSRSVLGLEPGESLELADPFGLIRTCSVANATRTMRLVLNVSQSQRTGTARAVRASGGKPMVHHIAFGCDDIFTVVSTLRARGLAFVPISGNYYDDLQARFGLEQDTVDRMRALGILFDRNDSGEYFHIYSEAFDDRFFFEIVQRSGYDAYGALNAPARMASLAQSQRQT